MSKLFLKIYFFFNNRKIILFLLFIFSLGVLGYFASKVELRESITQMLPSEKGSEQLASFLSDSRFSDRIVIAVSQKDSLSEPNPD